MKKIKFFIFAILTLFLFSCKYDIEDIDTTEETKEDGKDTEETTTKTDESTDDKEVDTIEDEEFKPYRITVNYYMDDDILYSEIINVQYEDVQYRASYGKTFVPTVSDFKEFDYWYLNDENTPYDFNTVITKSFNLHAKEKDATYDIMCGQYNNYEMKSLTLAEIEDYITNHMYDYCHNYSTYIKGDDDDFNYSYLLESDKYYTTLEDAMEYYKFFIKKNDMSKSYLKFITFPTVKEYTIEYDLKGGKFKYDFYYDDVTFTSATISRIVLYSNNTDEITKIDESGDYEYTFGGWYDEDEVERTDITYETRKKYKFHAKWIEKKIYAYVNYYVDGSICHTERVKIEDNPTVSFVSYDYGIETKGVKSWNLEDGTSFDFNTVITDDLNLYAESYNFTIIEIFGDYFKTDEYIPSTILTESDCWEYYGLGETGRGDYLIDFTSNTEFDFGYGFQWYKVQKLRVDYDDGVGAKFSTDSDMRKSTYAIQTNEKYNNYLYDYTNYYMSTFEYNGYTCHRENWTVTCLKSDGTTTTQNVEISSNVLARVISARLGINLTRM